MRYLKKFEALTNQELAWLKIKEELQEFSEGCLVYLLDEGFELTFNPRIGENSVNMNIVLYKPYLQRSKGFRWYEVRDYYIPFLQLLSRRYELSQFGSDDGILVRFLNDITNNDVDYEYATLDQVINDELEQVEGIDTSDILNITVQVSLFKIK
jgi:hypothetical protein